MGHGQWDLSLEMAYGNYRWDPKLGAICTRVSSLLDRKNCAPVSEPACKNNILQIQVIWPRASLKALVDLQEIPGEPVWDLCTLLFSVALKHMEKEIKWSN